MPRAVVVGGSLAGLTSALALARSGWQVDVVERDPLPDAPDAETVFAHHPRPAVPQAGHSHNFFSTVSVLLRDRAPDVLEKVLEDGVRPLRMRNFPPPMLAQTLSGPGDDDLISLATRRSTYEWALRRVVTAEPNVSFHVGGVTGLAGDEGEVPRVTGVRMSDGTVDADFVVAATGRRFDATELVSALGGRDVPFEAKDCEATYYTRYYRLLDPEAPLPPLNRGVATGGQFQGHFAIALPADRGLFSITIVVPPYAKQLRGLRHEEAFDAVVRLTPLVSQWLESGFAEAITDVRVIAGFRNSFRRTLLEQPYALDFALVGDVVMHTDPTFARGACMATMGAFALADALAEHADPVDREAAWRAFLAEQVQTRYDDVVARDDERHDLWISVWNGGPPVATPFDGDLTWGDVGRAAAVDESIWRALTRYMHVLDTFDEAITPELRARVRELRDAGALPPAPLGPSPEELCAAVQAAVHAAT
jgi:2-polyprenyl-6-methoxyphenol hydroxylase-like FAD-dependent oxidoreductase